MRKSRVAAALLAVAAIQAAGGPASALPPGNSCTGAYSSPGAQCTFTHHANPIALETVGVFANGSGSVTVTLTDQYGTMLASCTGTGFCSTGGIAFAYGGTYTCEATGTGSGTYGCVVT